MSQTGSTTTKDVCLDVVIFFDFQRLSLLFASALESLARQHFEDHPPNRKTYLCLAFGVDNYFWVARRHGLAGRTARRGDRYITVGALEMSSNGGFSGSQTNGEAIPEATSALARVASFVLAQTAKPPFILLRLGHTVECAGWGVSTVKEIWG